MLGASEEAGCDDQAEDYQDRSESKGRANPVDSQPIEYHETFNDKNNKRCGLASQQKSFLFLLVTTDHL